QDTGSTAIQIKTAPTNDVDYVLWGPFSYPFSQCTAGLTSSKILSCDTTRNSGTNTFTMPCTTVGEYYVLMVANYSNNSLNLSFKKSSGNGNADCDVLCVVNGLTATTSACGTGAQLGTYSVSGTVTTTSAPATGTLTVSSSCGGSA